MGTCDDDRSQAPSVADDDATTTAAEIIEDTIDPREQQQDIWAQAEGYTPLTDLQYSSLMVSMGPSDGEDETDDDDDEANAGEIPAARGAFFVNPAAFAGNDDDDGESRRLDSDNDAGVARLPEYASAPLDVGVDDFHNIADKALSLLDEEYERTLKGERRPPSWQGEGSPLTATDSASNSVPDSKRPAEPTNSTSSNEQIYPQDEDLKIIAAAFDERKKAALQNGFIAEWDHLPPVAPPTIIPAASGTSASLSVDTDAVRKVVQALNQKSDNPFQQKFAAWQERQSSLPATHDIIPATPYKAFRRSTDKAKQATASLSRSATLAEALIRIKEHGLLLPNNNNTGSSNTLVIDIVGVDHVECESVERIQSTFRPIIRWMGAWKGCGGYQHVHLRLIGRDLANSAAITTTESGVDLLTPQTPTVFQSAIATCHSGVYHMCLSESSSSSPAPTLSVAFNAGIWGYKDWIPTIQYLHNRTESAIPFVITAYTLEECQEDMDVIQTVIDEKNGESSSAAKVLWEAQANPFGSKTIRETKSSASEYRENAAWQAWLLGGC